MGDHAGTHVDAPCHFNPDPKAAAIDEVPLDEFFTEAVCLDLSHKPLKSDISIEDLQSRRKPQQALTIQGGRHGSDLYTGFADKTLGTDAFITDFPGPDQGVGGMAG